MSQSIDITTQSNLVLGDIGAATKTVAQLNADYPGATAGLEVHADAGIYTCRGNGVWVLPAQAGNAPAGTSSKITGNSLNPASSGAIPINGTDWVTQSSGTTRLTVDEAAHQFWSVELRRDALATEFSIRLMANYDDGNGYQEIMMDESPNLSANKWTPWTFQTRWFLVGGGDVLWRLEYKKNQAGGLVQIRRSTTSYITASTI